MYNKATIEALRQSHQKWLMNAKAASIKDVKIGWKECPLCFLFNNRADYPESSECDGCPVKDAAEKYCAGTPFDDAVTAWFKSKYGDAPLGTFHVAARAEADFLGSILARVEEAAAKAGETATGGDA